MQIVFHLGAYATDIDHLTAALTANPEVMRARRVFIPQPEVYRAMLRDLITSVKSGTIPDVETQDAFIALCTKDAPFEVDRLILTNGNFLAAPDRLITPHGLYAYAGDRTRILTQILPEDKIEFWFGLINPTLMLNTLFARQSARRSYDDIIAGQPPESLSWADPVRQIVDAAQGRPVVVWSNEETPVLAPELLRLLADLPEDAKLQGEFDLLEKLLSNSGKSDLKAHLDAHPDLSLREKVRFATSLLETAANPQKIEAEINLPDWTQSFADMVDAAYRRDTAEVEGLPGVTFITPA